MNKHLEVHQRFEVFVLFIGIFVDKLLESLSGDVFGTDCPLSVDLHYFKHFRDVKPCFLNTGLVERLVEYVGFGEILVEDLQYGVAVLVYNFVGSFCKCNVVAHVLSLLGLLSFIRFRAYRNKH